MEMFASMPHTHACKFVSTALSKQYLHCVYDVSENYAVYYCFDLITISEYTIVMFDSKTREKRYVV